MNTRKPFYFWITTFFSLLFSLGVFLTLSFVWANLSPVLARGVDTRATWVGEKPSLPSGPDILKVKVEVATSTFGDAFTLDGIGGADFRDGNGNATFFSNPSPQKPISVFLPGDQGWVSIGEFETQVKNDTGNCLTDIAGQIKIRSFISPSDSSISVNPSMEVPYNAINIGAMFNLNIYKSGGSAAAGASVTISPADSDPNGGRYTADSFGQVLGIHRYNCTLNHTVTVSLGSESKTTTLNSSFSTTEPFICNGQAKNFTITLSPPAATPTPTPQPVPAAPTNLRVAGSGCNGDGSTWVDVAWNAVSEADNYTVYLWTGIFWQPQGTTAGTVFTLNPLAANTGYAWRVTANNAAGSSAPTQSNFTTPNCAGPTPPPPTPPPGATPTPTPVPTPTPPPPGSFFLNPVATSCSGGTIVYSLSWGFASGATGYEVWLAGFRSIASVPADQNWYSFNSGATKIESGQAGFYIVATGVGIQSNTQYAPATDCTGATPPPGATPTPTPEPPPPPPGRGTVLTITDSSPERTIGNADTTVYNFTASGDCPNPSTLSYSINHVPMGTEPTISVTLSRSTIFPDQSGTATVRTSATPDDRYRLIISPSVACDFSTADMTTFIVGSVPWWIDLQVQPCSGSTANLNIVYHVPKLSFPNKGGIIRLFKDGVFINGPLGDSVNGDGILTKTAQLSGNYQGDLYVGGYWVMSDTATISCGAPSPPPSQPDLIVDSSSTTPTTPNAGDLVSISAVVKNQGTVSAGATLLNPIVNQLTIDGVLTGGNKNITSAIAAGGTVPLTPWSNVWTATAGLHTYQVCTDTTNRDVESDETNNCYTGQIGIIPDLNFNDAASTLQFYTDATCTTPRSQFVYSPGDPIYVNVTIKNTGISDITTPFRIAFYIDRISSVPQQPPLNTPPDPSTAFSTVFLLNAGATTSWCFTVAAPTSGGDKLAYVFADYQGAIQELDENNNTKSKSYLVNVDAWFETIGGDIGAQSGVITVSQNPLPAGRYLSDYLGAATGNLDTTQIKRWSIKNYSEHRLVPTGGIYNYMADRFRQKAGTGSQVCNISAGLPVGNNFYYCPVDANFHVGNGPNGSNVFFVDGNLTIDGNLTLAAADVSVFIVKGNINVKTAVTRIDGIYITGGTFTDTDATGGISGAQLVVNGAVYANSVSLARELGGASCPPFCNNAADPAERFIFDPKYLYAFYSIIGSPSIVWNEVAP